MDVSTRLMTGMRTASPGTTPALREILSGQARETTTKIDSLTHGIQGLHDHVDKLDLQRVEVEAEVSRYASKHSKSESQLKISLPAIVAGAVLSLGGGLAQAFGPSIAGIVTVCAGSVLLASGGILANTGRMNQTECEIMGKGAQDRLEIVDTARQRALNEIASREQQIQALRSQEADLLQRVQAEVAQPSAPGVILMEPETVRIGSLAVPRRLDG